MSDNIAANDEIEDQSYEELLDQLMEARFQSVAFEALLREIKKISDENPGPFEFKRRVQLLMGATTL